MNFIKKSLVLCCFFAFAFSNNAHAVNTVKTTDVELTQQTAVDNFLSLTPKTYREMTGEKLGIANAVKLKVAQKYIKKQLKKGQEPLDKSLYIILAILGWGFVGVGMATDWDGSDWIICLVLTALCWLPGVIYALAKMKNYY